MNDLIEALTIFQKYMNSPHPTGCVHDEMIVYCKQRVSPEDRKRLKELSFTWKKDYDGWASSRFGSA